ncbi:MAG: hypothetical protein ABW252_19315 [Polyangiales bacterium]
MLLAWSVVACDRDGGGDVRPGPPPLPTVRGDAGSTELAAPAPPPPKPQREKRPRAEKAPAPKHAVTVPRTAHVWAELPSGLQTDLDADPRMQAWLDTTIATIDRCHASSRTSVGVMEGTITMHENDRPDLSLTGMPAALSMVVACATGPLTRSRMPLFTGKEGRQYVVRLHFE